MHKQNQHIERIARSLARAAIIRANKLTKKEKIRKILKPLRVRLSIAGLVALIVIAEFTPILDVFVAQKVQAFEDPQSLLPKTSQAMADKLTFNAAKQTYTFNEGYTPQSDSSLKRGGPKITATANVDARKGLSVIDPTNQLQFGLKPKFELKAGEKKDNRVVYPLINGSGWLVYTMEAGQVKEDILLSHATKNKMELKYDLELGDSLEARMQDNGDIGVFGSDSPVVGNVSTGSDKDADLLQKARKATKKDKLIFVIPAPVIKESNVKESSVKAHYEVEGTVLTLKVEGLKKATYPLTIDPSVYVTSASQFMYGNNDSNIDFNTSSELIQKGQITGARIPSWQTNGTSLNGNIKAAGTTVAGGYVYMVGGSDGSSRLNTVYWGKFDPSGTSITSPTPSSSSGVCANFCTNSQYNLPQARSNLAVTTYNGYLYAIGGEGTGCGTNLACNTVYKSKIGANGEPNAWTAVSAMSTERKNTSAVAYNNRIYVAGGQTNSSLNGTQSVQSAAINPDGTLSTWTGVTNLSTATYGMTLLQYNGYLYAVAGASGATTLYNVDYAKINSDGTLDIWVQTVSSTAIRRGTLGGSFATIYGGYMYLAGGCSAMTTTSCTTALNDFNLASINADGSLTSFTTLPSITQTRTAYSLVSWRGAIYAIGGCSASGACGTPINTITYGVINSDGDVSNKFSGTTLPATGTGSGRGGRMAGGVVINNGYIYNIGGCITNNCKNDSLNTSYASINSDGTIGSWTTQTNTGLVGSLAMGVTVHNNVIYAVGGGTGGNFNSSMSRVSINANGSLSGNWSVTGNVLSGSFGYPFVFARTIPSNNTQSYLYMVGGCTGSAIGCTGYTAVTRRCTVTTLPVLW